MLIVGFSCSADPGTGLGAAASWWMSAVGKEDAVGLG